MVTSSASAQKKFREVERLSGTLKTLQDMYDNILKREGIRDQVQTAEYWTQRYHYGLSVSDAVFQRGQWLSDLNNSLERVAKEIEELEQKDHSSKKHSETYLDPEPDVHDMDNLFA